jgi:hypothetical protein
VREQYDSAALKSNVLTINLARKVYIVFASMFGGSAELMSLMTWGNQRKLHRHNCAILITFMRGSTEVLTVRRSSKPDA